MKKKKFDTVTKISAILTALLIVFVGVFCTSPSKAADDPFIPVYTDEETEAVTETEEVRETYDTIGEDLTFDTEKETEKETGKPSETKPEDPDTDRPEVTKPHTTEQTVTEPPATEPPATEPPTTVKETEPPITGEFSEATFRQYTGRDLGPDETIYDRYENERFSVVITKVVRGNLNYFICDVRVNSVKDFHTAFAGNSITGRAYTSKTASKVGAIFAVNGDFCGFRPSGIIIREGNLYRNKGSSWDFCYLDKDGNLVTATHSIDAKKLVADGAWQSWSFGPTLVKDGRALTKDEFVTPGLSRTAREPRTAIGQVGKLHYIILVVDAVRVGGNTVSGTGMTFAELARTFADLGCKTAYNLDGGGSTTLYYKGKVINQPCVNGERNVSDIVYFK